MIDIKELNEATSKVSKRGRKPIEGTPCIVVFKDGKEIERIDPHTFVDYAKEHKLNYNSCVSILNKTWCNHEGYAFAEESPK